MTWGHASFSRSVGKHPQLLEGCSRLGPAVAYCALCSCSTVLFGMLHAACCAHRNRLVCFCIPCSFCFLSPSSQLPTLDNQLKTPRFCASFTCSCTATQLQGPRCLDAGKVPAVARRSAQAEGDPMKRTEAQAGVRRGTTFHVRGIRSRADTPAAVCWPAGLEAA